MSEPTDEAAQDRDAAADPDGLSEGVSLDHSMWLLVSFLGDPRTIDIGTCVQYIHFGVYSSLESSVSRKDSAMPTTTTTIHNFAPPETDCDGLLPEWARDLGDAQTVIPKLAKDARRTAEIESILHEVPTLHLAVHCDAREMNGLAPNSVHLVVTSPPYWTLKEYRDTDGQLGHVVDYDEFLEELDKVWRQCFEAIVPGGRLICVVGDVCLSRRKNNGRHTVIPLHASIQEHCREIGFDNLAPIIWHKISNVAHEVEGGPGFLGKPYEPNAVIKNDIEFILMERKSGGYRSPSMATRILSVISEENHREWFRQIWHGLTGASTKKHPAPYPVSLAERLIRMFSFVGDTVLDPFMGTGSTTLAAINCGRNSLGYEIDAEYLAYARSRIRGASSDLLSHAKVEFV